MDPVSVLVARSLCHPVRCNYERVWIGEGGNKFEMNNGRERFFEWRGGEGERRLARGHHNANIMTTGK